MIPWLKRKHLRPSGPLSFALSSHHSSWPAQLHLHKNPGPARPAGCRPRPGRGKPLGHYQHPFVGHPAGPVTPTDAGSHAHPVTHLAAGENAGRNCPAAAATDATAHQRVWAAATGTGMVSKDQHCSVNHNYSCSSEDLG